MLQAHFHRKSIHLAGPDAKIYILSFIRVGTGHALIGSPDGTLKVDSIEPTKFFGEECFDEENTEVKKKKILSLLIKDRETDKSADDGWAKDTKEEYKYVAYAGHDELKQILIDFLAANIEDSEYSIFPS